MKPAVFGFDSSVVPMNPHIATKEPNPEASNDWFGAILDTLPDRIYVKDCQSRFLRISRALAVRIGVNDPDLAIGKTDFDFYPQEKAREFFEDEQRIIQTGEPLINKIERQLTPKGETAWASVT